MTKKSRKSFAAKVAKSLAKTKRHCPVCGEEIEIIKHIETITNPENNSLRFKENMVSICKCNRKDIFK